MTRLTDEQLKKIWLVSDTVLYPEAVTFMHDLNEQTTALPLPTSQVKGLFNIIRSSTYDEVGKYIKHQIKRNVHIGFYEKLDQKLASIERKRMQEEFQLIIPQATKREETAAKKELMLLLAREFIQHLIAENGMLGSKKRSERRG